MGGDQEMYRKAALLRESERVENDKNTGTELVRDFAAFCSETGFLAPSGSCFFDISYTRDSDGKVFYSGVTLEDNRDNVFTINTFDPITDWDTATLLVTRDRCHNLSSGVDSFISDWNSQKGGVPTIYMGEDIYGRSVLRYIGPLHRIEQYIRVYGSEESVRDIEAIVASWKEYFYIRGIQSIPEKWKLFLATIQAYRTVGSDACHAPSKEVLKRVR